MPKYWGTNYFAQGSFPEVGQKQKTGGKRRERERLIDGNNNGHGARKYACRSKPPGPKKSKLQFSSLHILIIIFFVKK